MLTALRLPFEFDSDRLKSDLARVGSDEWSAHYNASDYGGVWRGAALRSASGTARELVASPANGTCFTGTPLLDSCAYFRKVLAAFECPLKSVRLLALAPGSFIREHSDNALDFEDGEARIHVPVQTNADVEFYLSGERLLLEEGCSYYVNVNLPHRVNNRGASERIHLVIDVEVNDWIRELFARSPEIPRCAPRPRGVDEFRAAAISEPALRDTLRAIRDTGEFEAEAVRLGRAAGFDFHEGDVDALLRGSARPGAPGGLPAAAFFRDGRPWVEWIDIGDRRLTEPFFEETVRASLRSPYARFSRRAAPLGEATGRPPSGFIYHMSRCGSTLMGRMLSAAGYRVISEAPAIDRIVQEGGGNVGWVRSMAEALGGDEAYFVKLDAWHIHRLSLFREAFPDTPWVFLYRDPAAVLASHARTPGLHALPGAIDPAALEMTPADVTALPREEWSAIVLAKICRSALRHRDDANGLFVDYRELPDAVWGKIARRFGIEFGPEDIERMRDSARFDAKHPGMTFTPNRDAASDVDELIIATGLDLLYRQLQAAN